MEHHADFAVPVVHKLVVETQHERPYGDGCVGGRVLALGWWVDPGAGDSGED